MAKSALVDAGFLVALLSRRDADHGWAAAQAPRLPPPWATCEAVLSAASHLLGGLGTPSFVHCFAEALSSATIVSPTTWMPS